MKGNELEVGKGKGRGLSDGNIEGGRLDDGK